jgi:LysR family transcriptional regulator, glycine cleavage system transcriptional activator
MQFLHRSRAWVPAVKRLPPLSAVEAFVQTARLGSVRAAADALALSSPAVTRRVQSMERHVGRPLFERRQRAVRLNAEGERLLAEVGPALDELGLAVERVAGGAGLQRLRLGVPPLFASHRLMPSLGALRALEPDLHIDIDTQPHAIARLDEGLDAAIVLARDVEPPLYARRLARNRVVAVARRDLAEGPAALAEPADLAGQTVLLHRDLPDAFDEWREAVGLPDLEPAAIDHFDSGQLILDAAGQGLGVAFMFDMHVEDAQDPRIAKLFGLEIDSPYSYWFACRRSALARPPVRLFHDWLTGEPERAAA